MSHSWLMALSLASLVMALVSLHAVSHSWLMALPLALLVMAFIFIACREASVAHGALACVARDGIRLHCIP